MNPDPISKAFLPLSLRYQVVLIYGIPGKTGRGKTAGLKSQMGRRSSWTEGADREFVWPSRVSPAYGQEKVSGDG